MKEKPARKKWGNVARVTGWKETMAGSESFVYEASQPGRLRRGVSRNLVPGAFEV
jgi:hypothetical protein